MSGMMKRVPVWYEASNDCRYLLDPWSPTSQIARLQLPLVLEERRKIAQERGETFREPTRPQRAFLGMVEELKETILDWEGVMVEVPDPAWVAENPDADLEDEEVPLIEVPAEVTPALIEAHMDASGPLALELTSHANNLRVADELEKKSSRKSRAGTSTATGGAGDAGSPATSAPPPSSTVAPTSS